MDMEHTIECWSRGSSYHDECDSCLAVGDHTPAMLCVEEYDEGDGYISVHYCQDCYDAMQADKP